MENKYHEITKNITHFNDGHKNMWDFKIEWFAFFLWIICQEGRDFVLEINAGD